MRWNKKSRLSVLPAHERNSPTLIVMCISTERARAAVSSSDSAGFAVHPRSSFVRRGSTAVLRCTAGPGFTITGWLRDGKPLRPSGHSAAGSGGSGHVSVSGGVLTVKSFARRHHESAATDEGSYQCVASGPQGAVVSRPARLLTAGIRHRHSMSYVRDVSPRLIC